MSIKINFKKPKSKKEFLDWMDKNLPMPKKQVHKSQTEVRNR